MVGFSQSTLFDTLQTNNSDTIKEVEIPEIVVTSKDPLANFLSGKMGVSINVEESKKIPFILGEADPFKTIFYAGGVSQSGEANANIYVRGGNNDQNLIQLNGANVENPTHVVGIFSIFNPDIIDQIEFIKSGIPAEFGGRLSSVIDVKTFVNKPDKLTIDGSIGLISAKFSVKTPVYKHSSIYFSHRQSYLRSLILPFLQKIGINQMVTQNQLDFYDSNFGFNSKLGSKSYLSGYFYSGNDIGQVSDNELFSFGDNVSNWGNKIAGLQFNHLFSDKSTFNQNVSISKFFQNSAMEWMSIPFKLNAENTTIKSQSVFSFLSENHHVKGGLELSVNKIIPIGVEKKLSNNLEKIEHLNYFSENSLFIRDEWSRGAFLINAGVRSTFYAAFLEDEIPSNIKQQIDKTYITVEPRLLTRILLTESSSVKFSASKHYQFANKVPIVSVGLPVMIFTNVSKNIKPLSLWHFSGGYFQNFDKNKWEISLETYYKKFSNLLEFKGNVNDVFSSFQLDKVLFTGRGYAYGSEIMLRRNGKKYTGWINYTLGWNYRQFDGINNGKPYLASNDRRHDVSMVNLYELNDRWRFGATFVFATGSRLNLPRSWYMLENKIILEYEGYNSFKMPDYHRLDISATYQLKKIRNTKSELTFSIYNLYNRANPFMVFFNTKESEKGKYDFKIKMAHLLPAIPSFSWTFHY